MYKTIGETFMYKGEIYSIITLSLYYAGSDDITNITELNCYNYTVNNPLKLRTKLLIAFDCHRKQKKCGLL